MSKLTHVKFIAAAVLTFAGSAIVALPAHATTTLVFDTSQGEINSGYLNQGYYYNYDYTDAQNNDHLTGNIGTVSQNSFYIFDLSDLNLSGETVTGASLTFVPFQESSVVVEAGDSASGATTEPLGLFGVTVPATSLDSTGTNSGYFNDLDNGTPYLTTPEAFALSPQTDTTINLDSAAFADITNDAGGYFTIGAALINPTPDGDEYLFGGSSDSNGNGVAQILTVTLQPSVAPEPSQIGMLTLIVLGLGVLLLKARQKRWHGR